MLVRGVEQVNKSLAWELRASSPVVYRCTGEDACPYVVFLEPGFPGSPAGFSCVRSRNVPFIPDAKETLDSPYLSRNLSAAESAFFHRCWRSPSSRSI